MNTAEYRARARGRSRGRMPRSQEMYWPVPWVDASMTPNEAWAALHAGEITLDEFWEIIGAWST